MARINTGRSRRMFRNIQTQHFKGFCANGMQLCALLFVVTANAVAQRAGIVDISAVAVARRQTPGDSVSTRATVLYGAQAGYMVRTNWIIGVLAATSYGNPIIPIPEVSAAPGRPGIGLETYEVNVTRVVPIARTTWPLQRPLAIRVGFAATLDNYRGPRAAGAAPDTYAVRTHIGVAYALRDGAESHRANFCARWCPYQLRLDASVPLIAMNKQSPYQWQGPEAHPGIGVQLAFRLRGVDHPSLPKP